MFGLKSKFTKDVNNAKAFSKKIYAGRYQLNDLPLALQRFITQFNIPNVEDCKYVCVKWKKAKLKLSRKSGWKPIKCVQYNFLPDPVRLAYMQAKILGIFNLEAIDSFKHGLGNMLIKALGSFKLSNKNGKEIDRAELVTILAETMLIPAYAFQTYIHWEEIDLYSIKGTIKFNDIKVSGIFHFNNAFEISHFETTDRYFLNGKGEFEQTKWTAEAINYIKRDNFYRPSSFKATWNMPDGDFCYFNAEIDSITYNS